MIGNMRIAICNEVIRSPWTHVVAVISELGYEGVEIAPYTLANDIRELNQSERRRIREEAESHGLNICGLHWLLVSPPGLHLTHPDSRVRERTVAYLGELARLCNELGGNVMVLGSPKQRSTLPGQGRNEAWMLLREGLRKASRLAEDHGVVIALEPLARNLTDIINSVREALKMLEEVGSPALKINLDVYSMTDEERPYIDIIEDAGSHLVHFHANDTNGLAPGTGSANYLEILLALKTVGYKGWLSVEILTPIDDPVSVAKAGLINLREHMFLANTYRGGCDPDNSFRTFR
ncbi:MAG: sugar phosphate isomerase/epimerase family protein [Thermofilaceae archaeon]